MKYEVIDDFLEQEDFDEIQNLMMGDEFAWFFKYRYYANAGDIYYANVENTLESFPKDENELDQFQFVHTFYDMGLPRSQFMQQMQRFMDALQPASMLRINANLLTRLPTLIQNPFHSDLQLLLQEKEQKQWTTSIFYVNSNDGYTLFEDGTKVESVANRMLIFPAHMKHTGTSCTDQQTRVVINFNYYKSTT
jgi:hypothetical protein